MSEREKRDRERGVRLLANELNNRPSAKVDSLTGLFIVHTIELPQKSFDFKTFCPPKQAFPTLTVRLSERRSFQGNKRTCYPKTDEVLGFSRVHENKTATGICGQPFLLTEFVNKNKNR